MVWFIFTQQLRRLPYGEPFPLSNALLPLSLWLQSLDIHHKDPRPVSSFSVLKHPEKTTKLANDACLLPCLSDGTHGGVVHLFRTHLAARNDPATAPKGGNQQNLLLLSGTEAHTCSAHPKSILVVDGFLLWLPPLRSSFSDGHDVWKVLSGSSSLLRQAPMSDRLPRLGSHHGACDGCLVSKAFRKGIGPEQDKT